ncbi:hypothetical protein B296_00052955, partial [Ensete ventricosum]
PRRPKGLGKKKRTKPLNGRGGSWPPTKNLRGSNVAYDTLARLYISLGHPLGVIQGMLCVSQRQEGLSTSLKGSRGSVAKGGKSQTSNPLLLKLEGCF